MTVYIDETDVPRLLALYSELTGRVLVPQRRPVTECIDRMLGGYLSRWLLIRPAPNMSTGLNYHRDGLYCASEVKEQVEIAIAKLGYVPRPAGAKAFSLIAKSAVQPTNER